MSGLHSLTNTNVDISPLYGLQHTLCTTRRREMIIFLLNHRFFFNFRVGQRTAAYGIQVLNSELTFREVNEACIENVRPERSKQCGFCLVYYASGVWITISLQ